MTLNMAIEIILPKIDQDMREGIIVEWKKQEGQWIEKGEILYLLETEKITIEIEAPESGFLANVSAKVGDTVLAGTVIAFILAPGEKLPENISR